MTDQTTYHRATPAEVRRILESVRRSNARVRVFYGGTLTGGCWNDEWDTIGTIGRSMGHRKIPLMVANARSRGGGALLDHCIVAIQSGPGSFLYQHPIFHTGLWTIKPPTHAGFAVAVHCNGSQVAQFKRADQAEPYIAFMKGERWSKAAPATTTRADESLPTIYLRREPTTDEVVLRYAPTAAKHDIVVYRDEACTVLAARFRWDRRGKPRRNAPTMQIAFRTYRAIWLPNVTKRAAKMARAA